MGENPHLSHSGSFILVALLGLSCTEAQSTRQEPANATSNVLGSGSGASNAVTASGGHTNAPQGTSGGAASQAMGGSTNASMGGAGPSSSGGSNSSQASGGTATIGTPGAWWDTAFGYRRHLTLTGNTQPGEPTEIVTLVEIPTGAIPEALAGANGSGLRFTDYTGHALNFEVDSWSANGPQSVWVRLQDVAAARNAGFYMYYGQAQAPAISLADSQKTWPDTYAAVWHFEKSATDSTKNGANGADVQVDFVPGQVASGVSLKGTQHIGLVKGLPMVAGATGVTVSAWVNPTMSTDLEPDQGILLGIGTASTGPGDHLSRVSIAIQPGPALSGELNPDEGSWETTQTPTNSVSAGTWHFITAVADLKGNSITLYVDGVQQGAKLGTEWASASFMSTPSDRIVIGGEEDLHGGFYQGLMDELRVETQARSAEYVALLAKASASGFVMMGPEEKH